MADLNLEDGQSVPQHLQQQQQLAALLEQDRQLSDSVTWVPELIPTFVQRAVQTVLERPGTPAIAAQASQVCGAHPQCTNTTSQQHQHSADGSCCLPIPAQVQTVVGLITGFHGLNGGMWHAVSPGNQD